MQPEWHVVREIMDEGGKCVASEVISIHPDDGDHATFRAAAADAKKLQADFDKGANDQSKFTYFVLMR